MIKEKKSLATIACGIGVLALLAGCSGVGGERPAVEQPDSTGDVQWSAVEPVELTVSSIFTAGAAADVVEDWMDAVSERTEGAVTFDYYSAGTLHPATEALSALASGLTDVTFISNTYFPEQLPVSNWDDQVVIRALKEIGYPGANIAGMGQQPIHYQGESAALSEMREVGFIPLLPSVGGGVLSCTDEFASPEDLKGRQVRVGSKLIQSELEALGMVGVFTPRNEQYEALQRGVIDCAYNATNSYIGLSLSEVTPWVAFLNNAPQTGAYFAISTTAWESLAPHIQDVMKSARIDMLETFTKVSLDEYREVGTAAEAVGGGVIDPSKLNRSLDEWWAKQADVATMAPSSVADPKADIQRTNAIIDTWAQFVTETLGVDTRGVQGVVNQGSGIVENWEPWKRALAEGLGKQ